MAAPVAGRKAKNETFKCVTGVSIPLTSCSVSTALSTVSVLCSKVSYVVVRCSDSYRDGTEKNARKKDVRTTNIEAAKAVADAIRTSLGPRGMDKMVSLRPVLYVYHLCLCHEFSRAAHYTCLPTACCNCRCAKQMGRSSLPTTGPPF